MDFSQLATKSDLEELSQMISKWFIGMQEYMDGRFEALKQGQNHLRAQVDTIRQDIGVMNSPVSVVRRLSNVELDVVHIKEKLRMG